MLMSQCIKLKAQPLGKQKTSFVIVEVAASVEEDGADERRASFIEGFRNIK